MICFHGVCSADGLRFSIQGTKADGAITKLFVGKMKSFIKCVNVDYESARTEEFNGMYDFG